MKFLFLISFFSVFLYSMIEPNTKTFHKKDIFFQYYKEKNLKETKETIENVSFFLKCVIFSSDFNEEENCLGGKVSEKKKDNGYKAHKEEVLSTLMPFLNISTLYKNCIENSTNMHELYQCNVKNYIELSKLID